MSKEQDILTTRTGSEYVSVDDQYDGYYHKYAEVSQCNITFEHAGRYDAAEIESKLAKGLAHHKMSLEALQFDSLD